MYINTAGRGTQGTTLVLHKQPPSPMEVVVNQMDALTCCFMHGANVDADNEQSIVRLVAPPETDGGVNVTSVTLLGHMALDNLLRHCPYKVSLVPGVKIVRGEAPGIAILDMLVAQKGNALTLCAIHTQLGNLYLSHKKKRMQKKAFATREEFEAHKKRQARFSATLGNFYPIIERMVEEGYVTLTQYPGPAVDHCPPSDLPQTNGGRRFFVY